MRIVKYSLSKWSDRGVAQSVCPHLPHTGITTYISWYVCISASESD